MTYFNFIHHDFIVASLLGKGYLRQRGDKARFEIKLNKQYMEYIQWCTKVLWPFLLNIHHECGGEQVSTYTSYEILFKQYYDLWYQDYKKVIPVEIYLNPFILTHWFWQRGYHHTKSKTIKLYCKFSEDENERLALLLNKQLNLKCSVYRNWIIVSRHDYFNFMDILSSCDSFKLNCFEEKLKVLGSSKRIGYGAGKLKEKSQLIRDLHRFKKISRKTLAERFGVSITAISNVLNNVTYYDPNYKIKIGGMALLVLSTIREREYEKN